jgi:hypothetical protein
MDRATEIAHRVLPAAGSEWPMSAHGRAIALEHAANIIRAELDAEREACAKLADEQEQVFASPEYATGQPFSSAGERFACRAVAKAIRARAKQEG